MRRITASVVLAALALTIFALGGHSTTGQEIRTQAIDAPVVTTTPEYTGPTSESLNVTIARAAAEKKAQDEAAWYAEASRQADVRAWIAASQPRTKKAAAPTREGTATASAHVSYEPGSIEAIICSVFGDTCGKAIRIATCESGLDPHAYNRSGASGLFQIMMPMHADLFDNPEDVWDPWKNSQVAYNMSSGGWDWSAWEC